MNELIVVNNETQTVSARDLYKSLNVNYDFTRWSTANLKEFVENVDYFATHADVNTNQYGGTKEIKDYILTMETAKHICLMSHTEKGRECRQYLIDLEKAWNTPEQILARALKIADETINSLKAENTALIEDNKRMKPKEVFFDTVAGTNDAIEMKLVADMLGFKDVGRNKLFKFLRAKGVLNSHNIPYHHYIDKGWFRVVETGYEDKGEWHIDFKTLVYQKGIECIRRLLQKATDEGYDFSLKKKEAKNERGKYESYIHKICREKRQEEC